MCQAIVKYLYIICIVLFSTVSSADICDSNLLLLNHDSPTHLPRAGDLSSPDLSFISAHLCLNAELRTEITLDLITYPSSSLWSVRITLWPRYVRPSLT